MKISTKGRYGLRAMIDLAVYSKDNQVTLSSIAQRQGISISYLEQVFSILRKSNLVRSIKGAQGGYVLNRKPEEIKVGKILRVLEGELSVIDLNKISNNESKIQVCIREKVWEKMNERLNELIDNMTLEDLVKNYRKNNGLIQIMYYI
jgi:Rrf2 family transcriptional regulator, cysteine metabolism repressor